MAHPKRRQSSTRQAKRRTHDKAVAPTLAICPNCGEWHVYHTVCGACGYYRGKLAIEKEAAVLLVQYTQDSRGGKLSGCFKYYSIANLK